MERDAHATRSKRHAKHYTPVILSDFPFLSAPDATIPNAMASKKVRIIYRKVRWPIEWFLIGLAQLIIPPLSLGALLRLAHWIADTAYLFDRRGKAIAAANLHVMFGARMTPTRERALIRRSYRNMARVMVNVFWMSRDTLNRIRDQVSFDPSVLEALHTHRPAITVSAHLGNWEILSQAVVASGIPSCPSLN